MLVVPVTFASANTGETTPTVHTTPIYDGIVNGSFESFTKTLKRGWTITPDIEGWHGVRTETVDKNQEVILDELPRSKGIEIWTRIGKKPDHGKNQVELDGHKRTLDGFYQKFETNEATNLMFTAYARKAHTSDIEVYIDGTYVETLTPATANKRSPRSAYFYPLEAGEHSIMFKEVAGQDNGLGAVIDNIRLISDDQKKMLDSYGRHTHNFYEHVSSMYGTGLMAPGQTEFNAYTKEDDKHYVGTSPITGLRPVIEQAIDDVINRGRHRYGAAMERAIARRLTNLNDFSQLRKETQDRIIEMTGVDFHAMSKKERERSINHLLHSPIPFGSIPEILSPDTVIDLGFTHTLDKKWTRVSDQGDGIWQVWIISNNKNGSHTGHNLGEFKVQLAEGLTADQAREAVNAMIVHTNNNKRLTLDDAAKNILYGNTPRLDLYSRNTPVYDGIVNGSFESFTDAMKKSWVITRNIEGWYGVRAGDVSTDSVVDPDALYGTRGIEIWRNFGKLHIDGDHKIELDAGKKFVDAVYQKFSTSTDSHIVFNAYARRANTSDIEVFIDGRYVETITPALSDAPLSEFSYPLTAGEHSIMFKEVIGQNDGLGALIDNVRLVTE